MGQQVLGVLMEHDRDTFCGPKGKFDSGRKAVRAGSTRSEVTLGGHHHQNACSRSDLAARDHRNTQGSLNLI